MSKTKTKSIVFTRKPPRSAYFVGRPQDVPQEEAEEYIKLGFAVDPEAQAKQAEEKKESKSEAGSDESKSKSKSKSS